MRMATASRSCSLTFFGDQPDNSRYTLLLCMATAVVHLYSTSLYFGSEMLDGFANVDTDSFLDLWIKFGLANMPWLVFPWFVLYWGQRILRNLEPGR